MHLPAQQQIQSKPSPPQWLMARHRGVGALPPAQTIIAVDGAMVQAAKAAAGSLLTVVLPKDAMSVTSSNGIGIQAVANTCLPAAGQTPCPQGAVLQFILDGNVGSTTISWTYGFQKTGSMVLNLQGAPPIVYKPGNPTVHPQLPPVFTNPPSPTVPPPPATPAQIITATPAGVVQAAPLAAGAIVEIDFPSDTTSVSNTGTSAASGVQAATYACLLANGACGGGKSMIQYAVDGKPGTLSFVYSGANFQNTFQVKFVGASATSPNPSPPTPVTAPTPATSSTSPATTIAAVGVGIVAVGGLAWWAYNQRTRRSVRSRSSR